MAFDRRNLNTLSYADGFTLWRYQTPDAARDVRAPGYFDEAREWLRHADMLLVATGDAHGTLVVSRNEPGSPVLVDPAVFDMAGAA
jgi:hypothetical protein